MIRLIAKCFSRKRDQQRVAGIGLTGPIESSRSAVLDVDICLCELRLSGVSSNEEAIVRIEEHLRARQSGAAGDAVVPRQVIRHGVV